MKELASLRPFAVSLQAKYLAENEMINEEDAKSPVAVARLNRMNQVLGGVWDRWEWAEVNPASNGQVRQFGHVRQDETLIIAGQEDKQFRSPFRIEIVPKAAKLGVFQVSQQRDVRPVQRNPKRTTFTVDVPLLNAQLIGMPVTKNPTNHVKVAWFYPDGKDHIFELWEVAVASQYDKDRRVVDLFLTEQLVYTSKVYRQEGEVVLPDYPGWANWPGLRALFPELEKQKLPSVPTRDAKAKESLKLNGNQGRVEWYSRSSGAGAIITAKGPAKVGFEHIKNVAGFPVFREIVPDSLVQFDELVEPEDPRTQFKLEARGVVQL